MKKPLQLGLRSLALAILFFSASISFAQDTTSIQVKFQKPAFQTLKNQTFTWNGAELSTYNTILLSPRYNIPAITSQPFSLTNTTQLGLLKEMLDIIPSSPAINVIPGTGMVTYTPSPGCTGTISNPKTDFNRAHVQYETSPSSLASSDPIFDVVIYNKCSLTTNTLFSVNADAKIGFGTATPQTTYHFAIPKFQIGDNTTVQFKIDNTSGSENMTFSKAGYDLFKVNKDGKASAREFEVTLVNPFPDYVFEKNYKLATLAEVESYVNQHKHLPGIKPASEYVEQGTVNVGELQLQLLEKIEELTLHAIEQQKAIEQQQQRIETLEKQLAEKK